MNHIKNIRTLVGYSGFLSLALYMTLSVFGLFSVSEPTTLSDGPMVCGALVYIGFVILSLWNSNNLVIDKPNDEKDVAPWGIIFYLLFLAVEWLSYGWPMRGVVHSLLPVLAILLPSVISLITAQKVGDKSE